MTLRMANALLVTLTCSVAVVSDPLVAQQETDIGARLMQDATVRAAVRAARDAEPQTLADQIRLCEVPAPSFKEAERARVYAEAFRDLGLRNVRIDREGNVLGERPGQLPRP